MSQLGLYLHVPFCEVRCAYCHFAIDPRRPESERQERYTRALLAEIAAREPGLAADSVYFGGGTPSLIAPERIARLIGALRARFRLAPGAEITLEANPHDLDRSGYAALRAAGVNRLSLGAQSFEDAVLGEMGRRHAASDVRRAVEAAREAGFANLSIDLILGWPGETRERWERGLAQVAGLRPEHVSLYILEVEEKTALDHWQRRGRVALPADDLVASLYERAVERLGRLGLERYEISNFARPGFESRHNLKYWDGAPFLGYGMSAHSHLAGRRFWNRPTFAGYCAAMEREGTAIAGEHVPAARERMGEALFLGLRRSAGVDLAAFRDRHGVDPLAEYEEALRGPFGAALVEVRDGRLRLTDRGVLLSNEVFRGFV